MHIAITQRERVAAALFAAMAIPLFALLGTAEGQESGDVAPAPPSVGADVPLTYFGPAPADVQKELIGPQKLLKAGQVDLDQGLTGADAGQSTLLRRRPRSVGLAHSAIARRPKPVGAG